MTEDYPRWEDDLSWMEDETPFRIPAGKKLVCWLLDEETAAKLSGPLVVAAPDLLAACEAMVAAYDEQITSETKLSDIVRIEFRQQGAAQSALEAIAKVKGEQA